MKIVFTMMNGSTITGEGPSVEEAFMSTGHTAADKSTILSYQEERERILPTERNQDHPFYGQAFQSGEIRPILRKIAFFGMHRSALVHASPKKEKWLHQFGLPPHRQLSHLDYYEYQLTTYTLPNQELLLEDLKKRYSRVGVKHELYSQYTSIICELEEVIDFHRRVVEGISALQDEMYTLNDITMGAMLEQPIDVVVPFVNGNRVADEDYAFKFFRSNWMSRHMSLYQTEASLAYASDHIYEIIFDELYRWLAHCRAHRYNRYGEMARDTCTIFTSSPVISLAMIMSPDSYQYIISRKGYAESLFEDRPSWNNLPIPKAIHLKAAYFKWLRAHVIGRDNIEYGRDGQISITKGNLKRVEETKVPVAHASVAIDLTTEGTDTSEQMNEVIHPDLVDVVRVEEEIPVLREITPEMDALMSVIGEASMVVIEDTLKPEIQHLPSLDALKLQDVEYVIGGSAAAVLYGAKSINDDIDICVSAETVTRLLQEGLIKGGEKDGIHDKNYQSLDGHIDIAIPDISCMTPVWTWDDWVANAVVVDGHTFLTKEALITFYAKLVTITHAEKHITTLARLQEDAPHEEISPIAE